MTTLLLIRHGQSVANFELKFVGHKDADLTETGLNQAQRTAEFLKTKYVVDKVYASDLKRAFKTGKAVADVYNVDIISDTNLREIYAGDWEGNKFNDLVNMFEHEYNVWLQDIGNAHPNNGESVKQLGERIYSELTRIAEQNNDKTIVIATHATPIRVMQSLVQTKGLADMKNIPWVSNASVTELFFDNGSWRFGLVSQDEHLSDYKTYFSPDVKV